jgi:competence protein ComEC
MIPLRTADVPTYRPLVVTLAAVCAGVIVDAYLAFPMGWWLIVAVAALAVWFGLWRGGLATGASIVLLLACAAIGGAWHHDRWFLFAADDLGHWAKLEPQPVVIEGIVESGPRRMPAPRPNPLRAIAVGDRTRLDLRATQVRDADRWLTATGNATLIINGHLFGVDAGDRVRVIGQLVAPSKPKNPGEFDYAEYCRGNRLLSVMRCGSPQCVELLDRAGWWQPQRSIDRLRNIGERTLWQFISERNAGLASAMFLGLREELDQDQMDAFIQTGTVHLLVISGLNVGILAGCVMAISRTGWVSAHTAIFWVVGVTVLYATVTGGQPPVVRATILVLMFCFARLQGRRGIALNSLAAAAIVVLALNPVELFRAGTQLSFLAVAALITVGQSWFALKPADELELLIREALTPQERALQGIRKFVASALLVSFLVWVIVQPLVAAQFHLITSVAIPLGPLLGFPVAVAMASGFGVMAFGWIFPPLGTVCGFICDHSLSLLTATVEWARDLPGSRLATAGPAIWWLIGFYCLVAWWMLTTQRDRRQTLAIIAATIAWTAVGLLAAWLPAQSTGTLATTFLSVGHGLAIVVEQPDGKTLVYDAGSMTSPELAARSVANYLWSRGIQRIDTLVISHADADHFNGVPQLLEQFPIGTIYVGPRMFAGNDGALNALHAAIRSTSIPIQELVAGAMLENTDDCQIRVLHPSAENSAGSDNSNSIVLLVESAGHRLLLTGDLESPGLESLTSGPIAPIDVLLAPHHGSSRSDPPGFSQWTGAKEVVVSGGLRDQNATVRAAYEAAGARVFHTAIDGAVTVRISPTVRKTTAFCGP